jgi:two-component system sensor histidine kinase BaeS
MNVIEMDFGGLDSMKLNITGKLFFAIFFAASLAVVSSTLIMQWNLNRGFLRLINGMEKNGVSRMAISLENKYVMESSWNSILRDQMTWRQIVDTSFPELKPPQSEEIHHPDRPENNAARPPDTLPPHLAQQFSHRLFLLDANKARLIGPDTVPADAEIIPLHHQGTVIGYLGLRPQTAFDSLLHEGFLHEQRYAFIVVATVVLLLSAGLALLLATRLVRPLKNITEATKGLAQGRYSVRVPVDSNDELGRLATDFNALALAMEHTEQARRRWVADISHELRTPLTFLRSQVEAILDGVRQPTTESVKAIHNEIMRFSRLVDDLYQLSLSDVGAQTYRKNDVTVSEVLHQALAIISPEFSAKNITVQYEAADNLNLFGDAERLRQLFGNLLDNSLKYTDSGGELSVKVWKEDSRVIIDFQDSAPGVAEDELEKLFERLYRVESSRNRATGGAGLGLAICRNIVEAHEGSITAKLSPLGGLWVRVELPYCGSI